LKTGIKIALLSGLVLIMSNSCEKKSESAKNTGIKPLQTAIAGDTISGTIIESMDAGGYTYFQINTGREKIWAAVTQRELPIGLDVIFGQSMKMTNFRSETLDRTFDTIYFVENLLPGQGTHAMTQEMVLDQMKQAKKHAEAVTAENIDFSDLTVPEDGIKVADIYAKKNELGNKMVRLRGKVVKFVKGVMGKNWIHIQDGSGESGTNDITVTCQETVAVGNVISVEGKLELDKDFGFGYRYEIIVEDAIVIVE